jgi:hypothetical protein
VLSHGAQGHNQDAQNLRTWQHCTVPLSSTNADPILDSLVTTDDLPDEEDHTTSISPAAGSDQFVARSLEPSERRTAEPLPTSIVLTTRFGSPGTPSSTPTDTVKQGQAKRKRPAPSTTIRSQPAHDTEALSTVPRDVRDKWDEIAGQESLAQLRLCLRTQRSTWAPELAATAEIPEFSDTSLQGQLERYRLQRERGIKAVSGKHRLLAQVPRRLYWANISPLYLQEKAARKTRKRVRRNYRSLDTASIRQASILDEFLDSLLPDLLTEGIERMTKRRTNLTSRCNTESGGPNWLDAMDLAFWSFSLLI